MGKGYCFFVNFIRDFDESNKHVQQFCAYRFFYRFHLFGTKISGLNINKAQSIDNMEICDRCILEDSERNFNFDNPCDCQCTLHTNCSRMNVTESNSEFCAFCIEYLPIAELKERRNVFEESGDFEVEKVIDFDDTNNEYIVKWKNYPNAANCNTELSLSFIECVIDFWANNDQKITVNAQNQINSLLNKEQSKDIDEQLQNLEINKQCKQDIIDNDEQNDDNDDVEMKNNENTDNDKKKKAKKKKTSKKKTSKMKKDKKTKKKEKKNKNKETQNDDDTKKKDVQKNDDQKVDLSEISKGKFIIAKLTDVMDKRYIIRRQKYTKATYQRMIGKKNRYRQWMMKEMKNETPIGMDI